MTEADFLELSNDAGLAGTVVLTFNILLGMMLGTAYKKSRYWGKMPEKIRRTDINNLHNWTAYVALIIVIIHPLLLLFSPATKFRFIDILFPIHAPHQKFFVTLGVISLAALILVIITTQKKIKRTMSFRAWKNIHLISYATAILFLLHGVMMDPELKDRPADYLDGEKLLSECCALIILICAIIRYRYFTRLKKDRLSES
jgi:methionine sulfoxide reductase heme-binding subunit